MGVEQHITSDEEVLDYCTTDYWAWVCTDERIIKYRSNNNREQLDDISIDEITGISLTNTDKSETLLGYSILTTIGTVLLASFALINIAPPISFLSLGVAIVPYWFYKRWKRSAESYFELRGTGLIQQEPEKWRIQSGGNRDEVRSFVKTIREQI
ncbi:hypothetical protein GJ633_04010 [Halorubrum sp. CBA1125]|uniref:hypothetical protein n=1 Tax=Halorubrum sp. CBA1125 TaxID=2668072 RepID=UPI0012E8C245|nr:hypothetical protein [Halorubrum sp. CBA1125]MUW13916.1 hypothetical protein [Halorubrum sp. CBA1125]